MKVSKIAAKHLTMKNPPGVKLRSAAVRTVPRLF